MSEDRLLEALRNDARPLRFELPDDDPLWTRLQARVRERVARPTVSQVLVAWLRPLVGGIVALAIVAASTIAIQEQKVPEDAPALTSTNPVEVTIAGESFRVAE